jgi:hypothetical protein
MKKFIVHLNNSNVHDRYCPIRVINLFTSAYYLNSMLFMPILWTLFLRPRDEQQKKGESDAARRPNRLIYFFVASTSSSLPLTFKTANPITFNSFARKKNFRRKIYRFKAEAAGKKFGEGRR